MPAYFIGVCDPHSFTRGLAFLPRLPLLLRVETISVARSPRSSQQDRVIAVIARDRLIFGRICVDLRPCSSVFRPRRSGAISSSPCLCVSVVGVPITRSPDHPITRSPLISLAVSESDQ